MNYDPWLKGPDFLYKPEIDWTFPRPKEMDDEDERLEARKTKFIFWSNLVNDLVTEYKFHGNLIRVQKTFAYLSRFLDRLTGNQAPSSTIQLTSTEMECGLQLAVRIIQVHGFPAEYYALKKGKPLPSGSRLQLLAPFIDSNGILRVGGRLADAPDLTYDEKHPMLLPKNHPLTATIFFHYHWRLLHAGPQQLLADVRRKFWPIGGKSIATRTFRECLVCCRDRAAVFQQVMGNLPEARVEPFTKCFEVTGIDLCGPFQIKGKGRGSRPSEMYIAVFICFRTKAIQLQYVEGTSTGSIVNALIRFMSRAGRPKEIWSDNGTNFHGANNVFNLVDWLKVDEWCRSERRTDWKFIPARSPHFGGLWESAVKSAKKHLLKVMKTVSLHHDAFLTLLAMIESVLNNRPIIPIAINPQDGQPLTPAHFVSGGPMLMLPDPSLTTLPRDKANLVRSWMHLNELKQHWLRRWQREFRQQLQTRQKWHSASPMVRIGQVVLMNDRDKSPYAFTAARISKLFPGRDGRVRVVEVTTPSTPGTSGQRTFRRAITELIPLPTEQDKIRD